MSSKTPPTTSADRAMGNRHLRETMALERRKISDHEKALTKAKSSGNKASVKYNKDHIKGHQDDLKDRAKQLKKYAKALKKAAKS